MASHILVGRWAAVPGMALPSSSTTDEGAASTCKAEILVHNKADTTDTEKIHIGTIIHTIGNHLQPNLHMEA
jgi:hypothetical protein